MATNYLDKNLKDKERVDIVDKTGKITGQTTRDRACKEGLLHRAVNIVIINKKGAIFIQKRSPKKILPLYWDISASEHVKSGESYESAAIRGLKEELSILTPVKLLRNKHIQKNEYTTKEIRLIEYELVELYGAIYAGKIEVNQDEVSEGRFIFLEELFELIKNGRIMFSPWGLEEINYLLENPAVITKSRTEWYAAKQD